jgi:4-amino-4-deoxy-L-arabinose transferase-like glycosyltransferase
MAAGRARRDRWDWRLPAFLAAVFTVKAIAVAQLQHHPLLEPDGAIDTQAYLSLAQRVLGGDVFLGPGLYYVSPLYIYFLAAALGVSGSLTFVRLAQVALGTAAVACVFWTARRRAGERAAWIAASLAALTGVFTFYEVVVFQSSLDVFLTAAALACLTAALPATEDLPPEGGSHEGRDGVASAFRRKDSVASTLRWKVLLAGLLFGLQILNRPNIVVAVAAVVLSLFAVRRARVAALLVAGVLAALAPVVLRNAVVSRKLALASSQGGLNFYIGNHAGATGQYTPVPGVRANIEGQAEDTRRVAEQAEGRPLTDAEVSAHFTRRALDWTRAHPADAARLFGRKLALVFNARHQWLDFSYPYYAYDTGSILAALFVGPWLLIPLGLAGLVWMSSARSSSFVAFVPFVSFVLLYAVSVALFFVAERYRLPMLVALCVTGGIGADGALRAFRTSRPAHRASAAAALAAAAVLAWWPLSVDDGRFDERLRLSKVLMNRGEYGQAAMVLDEAHRVNPSHTAAEFHLGVALAAQGRTADGIAHIRHAVDAGVDVKGARYVLASTLLQTGDREGAAQLLRTYAPQPDEDAMSCYQVALLAMNAGARETAERYARRALELRPGWPEAQALLERIISRTPR